MKAVPINSCSSLSIFCTLDGDSTAQLPPLERKKRLQSLFKKEIHGPRYSEHVVSDCYSFREHACKFGLEGVISKRIDRRYASGD